MSSSQAMWWVVLIGVGAATWALVAPAPKRLPEPSTAGGRWSRLARWLAGRDDAWARRLRTRWAVVLAAALTVLGLGIGLPAWAAAPIAAVVGAVGWVVSGWIESDGARRRRMRLTEDLPELCELLAAATGAGAPLRGAVDSVTEVMAGPVAEDLRAIAALVAVGEPEPEAWLTLRKHSIWGALATDVARASQSGTSLIPALKVHADSSRTLAREQRERRARTAGVRSVMPMMVCFLPAFFLVGIVPMVAGLILQFLE